MAIVAGTALIAPSAHSVNLSTEAKATLSSDDTAQFAEIAETYLQWRADSVTAVARDVRPLRSPRQLTATFLQRLGSEIEQVAENGQALAEINGGYTRAEVDITPGEATVQGDTVDLKITEDTRLLYPNVQEGDPEAEEYSLDHTLTFKKSTSGEWLLSRDHVDPDTGPAPITHVYTPIEAQQEADAEDEGEKGESSGTIPEPGDDATITKPTAGYSYKKMVAYAEKYWSNPKSEYRTYGSDCTNFVSQAMKAGGWAVVGPTDAGQRSNNKKWFYTIYVDRTSYTWAGAENWYWFAKKHSGRTKILARTSQLQLADVLQADWTRNGVIDHTMIVTKVSGSEKYLTYHSKNTHNKKLSALLAQYPKAYWYAHRT
ncbi:amidase domain-containing protein [Streptomyces sp. NPDC002785]|uniref:amidase domain-containing protein n=1 Tax=Streptomyces sp. NPDC002785 TaxID=3154543 RepID=UPI003323C806